MVRRKYYTSVIDMTLSDHREIIDAAIFRFIIREISEHQFYQVLIRQGYTAIDAQAEIEQQRPNRAPYIFEGEIIVTMFVPDLAFPKSRDD